MALARPACRPSVMHVNTSVAPRSSDVVRALQSRPNASVKTHSPPEGRRSFCLLDNLGIEGPRFIIACPPAPASSRGANRTQRIRALKKTGGAFRAARDLRVGKRYGFRSVQPWNLGLFSSS